MPDIRLYLDKEHWAKHHDLDMDTRKGINKKAQQLICKELDKIPDRK
jgi:hypothetical protein